ncbi:MAG: adenine deaminase [Desulfococcaceae bacterium]|jgi:adenine deaminase|nr:adenine deaminase [Desulfococcaceae bacterium]
MDMHRIISSARSGKADLLFKNARIVNVFSGEIITGNIAVTAGYIVGTGDYSAEQTVDAAGRFAAPGFIDSHVHIESSMASVSEFVRALLPCGTTSVVADPHEIANVLGSKGIEYMLHSAENQPMNILFSLPSCVPASDMETSGASLGAEELAAFMGKDRIPALAEMMNYPGVIWENPDVLAKIELARKHRKPVDGHSPGLTGNGLNAYAAAGISSDHECTDAEDAREKLRAGMFIMVREGTGARNLDALFPLINEKNFHRIMWCTDDRHPHDILDEGHIDYIVRRAVALGLDPVMAIQMATVNPARYFRIRDAGAIAPGYRADILLFSDINAPRAEQVWCKGILCAENGKMLPHIQFPALRSPPEAMHLQPEDVDFSIPAQGNSIRVIEIIPNQLITQQCILPVKVSGGWAVADPEADILKITVTERYSGQGRTGKGFIKGLGLKKGAIAASVAHDSHNIIAAGADDRDMKSALQRVVEMKGGFAVACEGKILASLALPIAGLMSPEPLSVIREGMDEVLRAARTLGGSLHDPFMTLGFMALPVIPELKITDKGIVDVKKFEIVPLFADA